MEGKGVGRCGGGRGGREVRRRGGLREWRGVRGGRKEEAEERSGWSDELIYIPPFSIILLTIQIATSHAESKSSAGVSAGRGPSLAALP